MKRRATVLGASGFIGSHLARHLLHRGWEVTAVVRHPTAETAVRRLGDVVDHVTLVAGDACDRGLLEQVLHRADAVFPFAGRSGAAASMTDPVGDLAANGGGQLLVLETLRLVNPGARVVFPGSRLQYGRCRRVPVPEEHPQHPVSVYGVHKKLGEDYHRLYWERYGIPTTVLRISNPYGPFQDRPDGRFGIVGTFLARAAAGEDVVLYGDGWQLRDYIYIDDLARLCELAATRAEAVGEAFNASGPCATTLKDMAESVVRAVGRGRVVHAPWPGHEAAVETGDYVGDISKAGELLSWKPEVDLETGLAATWRSVAPAGSLQR